MKKTILGAMLIALSFGANANVFWKCDKLFQEFQNGEVDKLFIDVKDELMRVITNVEFKRYGEVETLERQVLNLENAHIEYKEGSITKDVMSNMLFTAQIIADQYSGADCNKKNKQNEEEGASIF